MTDAHDVMAALEKEEQDRDKDEERGEKWDPKPGDALVGTLVDGRWQGTKYGLSRLLTIREDETDKLYAVWCSSRILADAIAEKAPAVGSVIGIKYIGTKTSKSSGNEYKDYAVHVTESDFEHWQNSMSVAKQKEEEYASRQSQQRTKPKVEYSGPDTDPF